LINIGTPYIAISGKIYVFYTSGFKRRFENREKCNNPIPFRCGLLHCDSTVLARIDSLKSFNQL
jgi:hypothetical protein